MSYRLFFAALILTLPLAGCLAYGDECRYEDHRSGSIDVEGAREVDIEAGSGRLRIEGTDGLDQVRAEGRVCTSREALLDDVDLTLERRGERIVVRAVYPTSLGSSYARLDLTVQVPSDLALDVQDSSGSIVVRDVGALTLKDSSGSIQVEGAGGPVSIDDSSGSVTLTGVRGDVLIEDGSGSITVKNVEGSVVVEEDSSGSIQVHRVTGDVLVRRDSSGSISVSDVGGDFKVARDSSGGIHHERVAGVVDVPTRH